MENNKYKKISLSKYIYLCTKHFDFFDKDKEIRQLNFKIQLHFSAENKIGLRPMVQLKKKIAISPNPSDSGNLTFSFLQDFLCEWKI